ncbi:unnamed protein product [Fusarium equiseti]|uniref:CBM-cenC domain-containing protein n=1 Tax=Fusarium equiseti TaxID=61235 RepID=A0A8J2J432_FUSEQ|nr:unnamed protein product [Fusarium equiseti]
MMFNKLSAAAVAIVLSGQVIASPCKPVFTTTTSNVGTSATSETVATKTSSIAIESSSLAATSLSAEVFTGEAYTYEYPTAETTTSSSTPTSDTSMAIDVTTTIATSMTEQTTIETTLTILESLSETTIATDDFTTEAATTTAHATTTDASIIEASTSSSAPQCTFTGAYTNYVQNPSFDAAVSRRRWTTTAPWIFLGTPWNQPNAGRGSGTAMAIKYPDGQGSSSILQSIEGVVAGREYVVTYYFQLAEGSPLASDECRIGASAGPGGQNQRWIYIDGEGSVEQGQYNKQQFRITAENDDQRLGIGFFCKADYQGDVARVYIDDVSVYDYYEGCEDPTDGELQIVG